MTIKFSKQAKEELFSSAKFYENRVSGLGKRFKTEIKKQVHFIKNNPNAAEEKYNQIRVLVIKKFPFTIHYRIENEFIVIVAIFHSSRNPPNLKR